MSENVITVDHVSVKFNLGKENIDFVIKLLKRELKYDEFWALKDISFGVNKGERLGILGLNGSGKSTLLKVIANVYRPNEGSCETHGVIAPLLELGAGFDAEYTARENIYLYGAVLGYDKKFLQSKFDEIIEFAELRDFVDVPVKNYSSGMRSRLGFAICTSVEPDILILDEVLSVGDARFQKKCEARIQGMFNKGMTVLFVSHSIEQVKRICNKAMILDHGQLIDIGDIDRVVSTYKNKFIDA